MRARKILGSVIVRVATLVISCLALAVACGHADSRAELRGAAIPQQCADSQLGIADAGGVYSGGPGQDVWDIGFQNDGDSACTLQGFPAVEEISGDTGQPVNITVTDQAQSRYWAAQSTDAVTLKPGEDAGFTVGYFHGEATGPSPACTYPYTVLKLTPPGSTTPMTFARKGTDHSAFDACDGDTVYVSPVYSGMAARPFPYQVSESPPG